MPKKIPFKNKLMITTRAKLTRSQMMMWMGQKINPSDPLYNMILTFEINGQIEVSCFEKAFQKLVDKNDVLRSVVELENDIPSQVFFSEMVSPLEVIDLSGSAKPYEDYLNWVAEHKKIVFDFEKSLYQAVLFKISADKYVLYFNQHHLITDGWSMKFLYDELNNYYQYFLNPEAIEEKGGNSFEAYAQKNTFQAEEEATPYWQNKLDQSNALTPLYDNVVPATNSESTRVNFTLGKERIQKLKELTQDPNIRAWTFELALSNIFLTAIAALTHKVGNQDEFTIGVPYHNRLNVSERKTAGLFMELLPMRVSMEKDDTLLSLLGKLKGESLDVIKNAMIGKPPVALLKTFNVVMNFIPIAYTDFAGISMESDWLLADHVDPSHHIRLQVQDFNNDYRLQFDLNNTVFPTNQMHYVGQHFIQIIDAFIEDKHQKIEEIPIITKEELSTIEAWNDTKVDFNKEENLLSKFEQQVLENPTHTALLFNGKTLTYRELHVKSNQVAHFLIEKGVQKSDIIAVSFERSFEMMIYIYGILKAGAAYLPLDTEIPQERLNFILENAEVNILLNNHDGLVGFSAEKVKVYNVFSIENEVSVLDVTTPLIAIEPDDLAYVIYTSGSTGEPKGVKCHHKGICNRLNWMNADFPISKEDTLLQKTPITFDVSVWELFWPLQVGSKLVIELPEGHKNPDKLIKTIFENNVTVVHFVPSMLNVFTATKGVEACKSLQRIFCSGEALSVPSVEKVHEVLDVDLYNLYGPTEASVDVTSWHCKKGAAQDVIPIGYPVANTKLYILDNFLNQVPIGVAGELYIAGVQVADGYLNNQELTEDYFLKDIFSDSPDARLYKTGDLARYGADGAILYLGRVDTQIKLRGLRIELGEIEKTLEKHSGISQTVVKVEQTKAKEEFLVAYYTGTLISESEITSFLEKSLPVYMIPSLFVNLEKFEFLSSGKINRKKLREYSVSQALKTKPFVAPTNEFEEIIAGAWCEVMKLEKVGIDENFIHLGGNSLNAIFITSRLKAEFELDLTITLVFNYPTIQSYAAYVEKIIMDLMAE